MKARSSKSYSHLFLNSYFRVRAHSLFGLRRSASVVVLDSNEYIFTLMVNARKHGMFGQNRNKFRLPNNRISSLPSVAGKITQSHFASLKSCAQLISCYVRCYASDKRIGI